MDGLNKIKDRIGIAEMAQLLRENKLEGAAMVFGTLPERDQELILAKMLDHMPSPKP